MTATYYPNAEMQGSSVEKLWPPESIQLSFKFQALSLISGQVTIQLLWALMC